ncbi:hypothetical protein D9M69_360060 [compost metagenome]
MVAGQVGEHRHVEIQRGDTTLLQPVGGDFHGDGASPGLFQAGQGGLYGQRIRGGMAAAFQLAIEPRTQGADDSAALAQLVEGLGQQLADAGLAVGAGDAHQAQGTTRLAIEAPGDGRQLTGQAFDRDEFGAAGLVMLGAGRLMGHGYRATGNGIGNMGATVLLGAGNGQKQVARTHLAAVQGQFTNQGGALRLGQ